MIIVIGADSELTRNVAAALDGDDPVEVVRRWADVRPLPRAYARVCVYVTTEQSELRDVEWVQRQSQFLPIVAVSAEPYEILAHLNGIALRAVVPSDDLGRLPGTVARVIATAGVSERLAQSIEKDAGLAAHPFIRDTLTDVLRSPEPVPSCTNMVKAAACSKSGFTNRLKKICRHKDRIPTRLRRGAIIVKAYDLLQVSDKSAHSVASDVGIDRTGFCRILRAVLNVSFNEFKRMAPIQVLTVALNEMGLGELGVADESEATAKRRDPEVQTRLVTEEVRQLIDDTVSKPRPNRHPE